MTWVSEFNHRIVVAGCACGGIAGGAANPVVIGNGGIGFGVGGNKNGSVGPGSPIIKMYKLQKINFTTFLQLFREKYHFQLMFTLFTTWPCSETPFSTS